MTTRRDRILIAASAMLAMALLGACTGGSGGDAVPELTLGRLDGAGEVDLAASDGTPRVLNLWATWCAPCRRELPAFDEVSIGAGDSLRVIGVNVGDSAATAGALVEELGLEFDQLLDPDSELSVALGVTSMPSTAFVDGDGQVIEVHAGALDADELRAKVDELLGVEVPAHG